MFRRTLAASLLLVAHAWADPAPPAPTAAPPTDESTAAPPTDEPAAAPPTDEPAAAPPTAEPTAEVIEVTGDAPPAPGAVHLDADEARRAPGAFGEPLRALALLPGVAMPVSALGYPVIRGALPGESRFSFDGIELPMLYHFLVGNEVIHPALIGDLELRAGGYGAEHGRLVGGLVTMEAADEPRTSQTELRATIVEIGAIHAHAGKRTSWVAALRAGTLAAVKLFDNRADLQYVDQQLRVVHRLGGGDRLVLTSLGAFDYSHLPPEEHVLLGFHRLDARWERTRPGVRARAGIQTELDYAGVRENPGLEDVDGDGVIRDGEVGPPRPISASRSAGVRPYAELAVDVAPWLALRAGADARYRALRPTGEPLFPIDRPGLEPARATDAAGAWLAADIRLGRLTLTPGLRADTYRVVTAARGRRSTSVDVRLAATVELRPGVRAELAAGTYTAPPGVSVASGSIAIGPVPSFDGLGASLGLDHGRQAELAVRAALPGGFDARLAAFWRDTHHAIDFGLLDRDFGEVGRMPCGPGGESRYEYADVSSSAYGVEAMVRRSLGRRASGWLSYTLAKADRTLRMGRLPHDFDQRHTLNAAVQVTAGAWQLGAGFHLHTGRPAIYPRIGTCFDPRFDITYTDNVEDPTRLRRLPITWRVDVRAQRNFRFSSWSARLVIEIQNAALRPEHLGWRADEERVVADGFAVPVPMIGFEADL